MKLGVCLSINPNNLMGLNENIKKQGADFLESNHFSLSQMEKSDFEKVISYTRSIDLPLTCTNSFLGSLRPLDSAEEMNKTKEYIKRSFERFTHSDLKHITLGSGASRSTNENRDLKETQKRFFDFCIETVAPLAKEYNYTIGIEPLNKAETDFLTTTKETFEFIKSVNMPQIKMIVDYFHFSKENENVNILKNYKDCISHLHIASFKSGRTAPLPEDNETNEYTAFLNSVKPVISKNTNISVEGGIIKPFSLTSTYLKELI